MARVDGQGNHVGLGEGDQAAQFASMLDALKGAAPPGKGIDGLIDSIEGADGDNHITAQELADYMQIPLPQAEQFLKQFNTNTKGETTPGLDATELTDAFKAQQEAQESQNGGNGQQSAEGAGKGEQSSGQQAGDTGIADLLSLLKQLGITPDKLEDFIKKYDKNGDGQLDKQELAVGLKAEAKAKGADISGMQIDTIVAKADGALTKADTDGKEGLNGDEFSKLLSTSAESDA